MGVTPVTTDTTHLNFKTVFTDRMSKCSLNSTFINTQETPIGTRNLSQQVIQTPSHFLNEEIVEKLPTPKQQTISPIHPALTKTK